VFDLAGRVALVTGAASGIGAATARRFAEAGADLVLAWYSGDPHDVGPTAAAVEATGRRAVVVEADVSETAAVDALVTTAVNELGRLDIVVANAAIARDVPSAELDDARWRQLMEINLHGVFRCFRAAIPTMVDQGHGRLLATSSIAGAVQGWARHAHYCASKAGVAGLVKGLALEVAAHNITVNAVAPGVIVTPQTLDAVNSLGEEGLAAFGPTVPVGRNGRPEEIAAVFHFLASDEASYLTGQVITVDGGVSLSLA
jgi:3-oxoacyl-[acyl-carrier protein] reductase